MNILYDYQAFCAQTHGGVSRCFAELYRHLPKCIDAEICVKESDNAYLKELGIGDPSGELYRNFLCRSDGFLKNKLFHVYCRLKKINYSSVSAYNKDEMVKVLQKGNFDVLHGTFFDDYFLPYLNGKPFVLTIHDMIPWIYSNINNENWKWQVEKMKVLAPKASAIVAVSENTKEDIMRYLNIPENKIHVVYHGCSFPKVSYTSRPFAFPYILYVGERNYYKNFSLFVRFVAPILKCHPELKVVCTGHQFCEDEKRIFKELGVRERFIRHWVKNDEEFYSLYHHAVCFVYTSEYEGFGIPILEAYQADCPVMLNNASCFPEIAGDAAVFFEMKNDVSDFSEKFEELYSMSDEERSLLLKKQRDRLQFYSWEKSAVQLTDIYRSIV